MHDSCGMRAPALVHARAPASPPCDFSVLEARTVRRHASVLARECPCALAPLHNSACLLHVPAGGIGARAAEGVAAMGGSRGGDMSEEEEDLPPPPPRPGYQETAEEREERRKRDEIREERCACLCSCRGPLS